MEENEKIELERANLSNYVLRKENEILLGTIGALVDEKKQLLKELEKYNKNIFIRILKKLKKIIRKHKEKKHEKN